MKTNIRNIPAFLLLATSIGSYVFWRQNEVVNIITILTMILYVAASPRLSWVKVHGSFYCASVSIFIVYYLSVGLLNSATFAQVVIQVAYAFSAAFCAFFGCKLLDTHVRVLGKVSASIVLISSILIVLALFIGYGVNSGRQGFAGFPAVEGLARNVNYNLLMVSIASILTMLAVNRRNKVWLVPLLLVFLMLALLMSGSRGGALSLLFSSVVGLACWKAPRLLRIIFVALPIVILSALTLGVSDIDLLILQVSQDFSGLRLEKGLNNRDVIWLAVQDMFAEKPFFGWGDISRIERALVTTYDSPTMSVQGGYLMLLLRGGAVGLLIWAVILTYVVSKAIRYVRKDWRSEEDMRRYIVAFMVLSVILIDNLFRSYMPGGVGFIPLMMLSSMSYLNAKEHLNSIT